MAEVARELLNGAIDMHIHSGPDAIPRLLNDIELARSAREAGMAAIVLKSHHLMTADRAQIAQAVVPDVQVFGGLAFNAPACGGLNPEAAKTAIRLGAKLLWLPTLSAANHIESTKRRVTGNLGTMSQGFAQKPVEVLDDNGAPRPELKKILMLVAEADIVLGTGHLSASEIKVVVDAALEAGVKKILVTHADHWLQGLTLQDQLEIASKGAVLERCCHCITAIGEVQVSPKAMADQIRAVGAESAVMATDYGQTYSPAPTEGMLWFIRQMLEQGISAEDIECMVKVNPARLLGI
jgi:hypothetical protein